MRGVHWNARLLIDSTALITCMISPPILPPIASVRSRRQQADHAFDLPLQIGLGDAGNLNQHRAELTGLLADCDERNDDGGQQAPLRRTPDAAAMPSGTRLDGMLDRGHSDAG